MKKRLLSLILAVVLILGMIPATVFAEVQTVDLANSSGVGGAVSQTDFEGQSSASVYVSLSRDEAFMVGPDTGKVMAMVPVTVPYFDLALYGLEEYYFVSESYTDDGDNLPGSDLQPGTAEYAYGKVTALHLLIYMLEVYYIGIDEKVAGKGYLYEAGYIGTDVFSISGSVGSSFMTQFWGGDCNLNYYVNYQYPLASEGWGATSDQILLRDGDILCVGHFSSYSFCWDTASVFNFITASNNAPVSGEKITLTVNRAGSDFGGTYETVHEPLTCCPDVYYIHVNEIYDEYVSGWNYLGTAESDGTLVVDTSDLGPGEYFIAVEGQYGNENPDDICSAPGGMILKVKGSAASEVLKGDVDNDGGLTGNDALVIMQMVAGLRNKVELDITDMDNDGELTGNDALWIMQMVAGLK